MLQPQQPPQIQLLVQQLLRPQLQQSPPIPQLIQRQPRIQPIFQPTQPPQIQSLVQTLPRQTL